MGRRRTKIGQYGVIRVREIRPRTKDKPAIWEARTRFRARNGAELRPCVRRATKAAAEDALKDRCADLAKLATGRKVTPDTRFDIVVTLWLEAFERKVAAGDRAHKSFYDYRSAANLYVRKRFGDMTCAEIECDPGYCDEVIKDIRDEVGLATARRLRVVLSSICASAIRHQAMVTNPIDSVEELARRAKADVRVLEPAERQDYLDKVDAAVHEHINRPGNRLGVRARAWEDLPLLARGGIATGGRIGELLAATGDDVTPAGRKIVLGHHLTRVEGVGMVREPLRKGGEEGLEVIYPTWAASLFRDLKLRSGGGPLFPTWNGAWEDPTNVMKRFRAINTKIGYDWVGTHAFRRTYGTHLSDSGAPVAHVADALGNTAQVVEQSYRRKRRTNAATAHHVETMFDIPDDPSADETG